MTVPPNAQDPNFKDLEKLTTLTLLGLARVGNRRALELLLGRVRPRIRRWIHGRIPIRARDSVDTDDIVQETLIRALNLLDRFEPRHEGAFLSYLMRIAQNLMRDELRKANRRPERAELGDDHVDGGPSPLDDSIGSENVRRYESALCRLSDDQATAIRLRLELQLSHTEIAQVMSRVSENAARLLLQRAMRRLAWEMRERPTR